MYFWRQLVVAMSGWCIFTLHAVDRQEMVDGIVTIHNLIQAGYAPLGWKREFLGWDDAMTFARAQELVHTSHPLSLKRYHQIVRDYLGSLHDHHVAVLFFSTESATLPFSVQCIQGRYFVDWIDTKRLPVKSYDIQVGDELLLMDGVPVSEVAASLSSRGNTATENPATDQALLAMGLTRRVGVIGDLVPQGVTTVTFQRHDQERNYSYQLMWRYQPEWISPLPPLHSLWSENSSFTKTNPSLSMMSPLYACLAEQDELRPGSLGAKKSFIPELGEVLWSSDEGFFPEYGMTDWLFAWIRQKFSYFQKRGCESSGSESQSEASCWYSYIYRSCEGRRIGYVRIPSYDGGEEESQRFGELMNFLEERTEALVIDQVHNPGGYVRFLYDLCSMIATDPLVTPRHRMQLTQSDVMHSRRILDMIYEFLRLLDSIDEEEVSSNSEIENILEEFNYQNILFYKEFHEFIIKEWEKGHLLTDPIHIEGVDHINPHPVYRYSKPILVLTNSLDFSGADFLPCILQDNKRAVIFGSRTAGAGGCVTATSFVNRVGVRMVAYTNSIAERLDGGKIENLGVSPDIPYEVTREDLIDGYEGYVQAVNRAVESILSGTE